MPDGRYGVVRYDAGAVRLDNNNHRRLVSVEGKNTCNSCPRPINCCIAVLVILIIGVLVVQACLNLTLIAFSLTDKEDNSYLLLAVNSTYILPIQENAHGIEFSFINEEDAANHNITFKVPIDNNMELESSKKTFHWQDHECLVLVPKYDEEGNCFIVRYWPRLFDQQGGVYCSSDDIRVVWKWFPLEIHKTSNSYEMLNFDCPLDLSSYPICDGNSLMAEKFMENRPNGDQIIVIRLCAKFDENSENYVHFEVDFTEPYLQLSETNTEYEIGQKENNKMTVPIPLVGNEQRIEIQIESGPNTVKPKEIKFDYINYEDNDKVFESTAVKYMYMCFHALVPITVIIVAVILRCCCYKQYK